MKRPEFCFKPLMECRGAMAHPEGFGVKADDVQARLRADFSDHELEAAEAVLARCGPIRESLRVQFAVLELAKGDLAIEALRGAGGG